jgi:hypothetical protein
MGRQSRDKQAPKTIFKGRNFRQPFEEVKCRVEELARKATCPVHIEMAMISKVPSMTVVD